LKDTGRVKYGNATDKEALTAFNRVTRLEGIIPALEAAHALAYLEKHSGDFRKSDNIVICLSGRGDKDMPIIFGSRWG